MSAVVLLVSVFALFVCVLAQDKTIRANHREIRALKLLLQERDRQLREQNEDPPWTYG